MDEQESWDWNKYKETTVHLSNGNHFIECDMRPFNFSNLLEAHGGSSHNNNFASPSTFLSPITNTVIASRAV